MLKSARQNSAQIYVLKSAKILNSSSQTLASVGPWSKSPHHHQWSSHPKSSRSIHELSFFKFIVQGALLTFGHKVTATDKGASSCRSQTLTFVRDDSTTLSKLLRTGFDPPIAVSTCRETPKSTVFLSLPISMRPAVVWLRRAHRFRNPLISTDHGGLDSSRKNGAAEHWWKESARREKLIARQVLRLWLCFAVWFNCAVVLSAEESREVKYPFWIKKKLKWEILLSLVVRKTHLLCM